MNDDLYESKNEERKLFGHIGVDSGLVWIGDPCYVLIDQHNFKKKIMTYQQLLEKFSGEYTSYDYSVGHEGLGVCIHSPIGDGTYPVYGILDNEKRIKGVYIEFTEE